jgi:hypothetical protein
MFGHDEVKKQKSIGCPIRVLKAEKKRPRRATGIDRSADRVF